MRTTLSRYEAPLLRYATRIVGDVERAREVVQDTFLRLWAVGNTPIESHLPRWLFFVCRNRAIEIRRREHRLHPLPDTGRETQSSSRSPRREVELREDVTELLALVATLPPRQRALLRMRFADGATYREMAEATGLSVSNVGYLIHVAIRTLRSHMTQPRAGRGAGDGDQG